MCEHAKVGVKDVDWRKPSPLLLPTFVLSDACLKPNSLQMIPNISFVVCEFEEQRLFESEAGGVKRIGASFLPK